MPDPAASTQPRAAIVLAVVGGWVDAVGFLTLFGLFTAHVSGNTARFGVELGRGDVAAALTYGVPVFVFFAAVAVGAALCAARRDRGHASLAPLLLTEAALVATFMVIGTLLRDGGDLTPRSLVYYGLAVAAVAAMGLQTASLRETAGVPVHTTFMTGMVTSLAEELVRAVRRDQPSAPHRARVHGALLGAYLAGAVGGSALESAWALWSLAVPVAALVVLAATARERPAEISETR
jgi:uncharacterized membrane protein YoaK (UPF0700 family)